jgi:hypothetical protein
MEKLMAASRPERARTTCGKLRHWDRVRSVDQGVIGCSIRRSLVQFSEEDLQ